MNLNYHIIDFFSKEELECIKLFAKTKLFPLVKLKMLDRSKPYNGFTYVNLSENFRTDVNWLLEKYPELDASLAVLTLKPGQGLECHLDKRNIAVNFPVTGCTSESPTIFYGDLEKYKYYYKESVQAYFPEDGILPIEEDRVYLEHYPMILDVKRWHSIYNLGTADRIMVSWNFKKDITYKEAVEVFSKRR